MQFGYSLYRFEEFGRLSPGELEALIKLSEKPYSVERGHVVRRQGDPAVSFFLLLKGWVLASTLLPNGSRQVLKVHLPGDVLGTPSMSSDSALETLTTVTPTVVSAMSLIGFGQLAEEHPRVAMRFLLSVQRERAALMDQRTSMGQTRAEARMAALLLDLAERLEPLDLVHDGTFDFLLTQEQIGDVLGLTSVHVNRTLRGLEKRGLIARTARRLSILARAELVKLAARPRRPPRTQLDWLPAGR